MRHRVKTTPVLDLAPIMGLCTLLIPLVLMSSTAELAAIQTSLPGF